MAAAPRPSQNDPDVEALAQAIREAVDTELEGMAAALVATRESHPFGATEFQLRALAHKIAAKAIEQHLAQKKMATREPA